MHVRSSGFLNPTTLATLETAFDEAWATLDGNGDKIRTGELARCTGHSRPGWPTAGQPCPLSLRIRRLAVKMRRFDCGERLF
jgi:hypothetical protein